MSEEMQLDQAAIEAMARAADLPLTRGRAEKIAPPLSGWLTAANELNRKMSAHAHRAIAPIAVFTHPASDGGDR
jgi:nitrogen-specific signal transduction histidine kinase